eukprot:TRINITY_DN31788_c0_g1_i1.p1 TRINITY_DN31788_c0_g1~~TRINITY_DN31788_c0_g1_i1.p1  ORF type:complete len:241 (+),score=31.47 TRINITY_DN31788_c0_g1_i1:142-864(+)
MKKKGADYRFKVVMIGSHGVGKTQLINRYTMDEFVLHHTMSLGVLFTTHRIEIEGNVVEAQLWDTAGQEIFKSLTKTYFTGAVGAMLVYDITKGISYKSIAQTWLEDLKSFSDPNIVCILIGNKCDLHEGREVETDEALNFAQNHGIAFMETSAKESTNVQIAFEHLLHEIYKIKSKKEIQNVVASPTKPISKGIALKPEVKSTSQPGFKDKAHTKKKGCCEQVFSEFIVKDYQRKSFFY